MRRGVLKLLEPVNLEDGEEVLVVIKRDIEKMLKKYRGILGKASFEELLELEERAHVKWEVCFSFLAESVGLHLLQVFPELLRDFSYGFWP